MEQTRWYRITVKGTMPARWADRLGGMRLTPRTGADGGAITVLAGRLRDQAALAGVCNTLYQIHLPILEITSQVEEYPDADLSNGTNGMETTT